MADLLLNAPIQYEPQKQNRFIFRFPSDLGIQEWWVSTGARPKIQIETTPIPFLNTKTYVAAKYEWQAIPITLKDPIGPSASQAVMEWVRLIAESVTGRMGYAAGYMRDVELDMLDPTGAVISKWILKNCFLADNVDFGQLSYDSTNMAEITLSLRPQYCILAY